MKAPTRYFVSDRALDFIEATGDTFEFKAVADTLVRLIASAEPPFSIALLGPWGSGKTTLINDVLGSLRVKPKPVGPGEKIVAALQGAGVQPRDLVVYVDAWKYDAESLRRQLLIELERRLKEDGFLPADAQSVAERLYQEAATTESAPPKFRWKGAVPFVPLMVLLWLVGVTMSLSATGQVAQIGLALLQLAGGVTLYLAFTGTELFRRPTATITKGPLVNPEQFEHEFAAFIAPDSIGRLILVLDNIDRMTPEGAIATLTTLKTYLEPASQHKGIFLVPLDDTALRAHLRTSFPHAGADVGEVPDVFAREYLRKFFAATVRVPPLWTSEMVAFIEGRIAEITLLGALPEETRRRVAQLLASVPETTPRRAKRHLNAISARLAILDARSELGEIRMKEKPQAVLCLAMLTVIEEEWPDLFSRLAERPSILREWHAELLQTETVQIADPVGRGEVDALRTGSAAIFISNALRRVALDDVRTLIRLKLDATESRVEDYQGFVDELTQGNREQLAARLQSLSEEDRRAHLAVAFRVLDDHVERTYFDNAAAVGAVIVESRTAWGPALDAEMASGAAERYAGVHELRQSLLTSLSPRGSVWLIAKAVGRERAQMLAEVSRRLQVGSGQTTTGATGLSTEDVQRIVAVAAEIAAQPDQFAPAELEPVRAALLLLPPDQTGLDFLVENQPASKLLVSRGLLERRVARVFADPAAPSPVVLDLLFRQPDGASCAAVYEPLVGAIEQWLGTRTSSEALATTIEGLSVARWPLDALSRELLDRYRGALQRAWSTSVQEGTKVALARELLRLRPFVTSDTALDDAMAAWFATQPFSALQAITAPLVEQGGALGRDLVLAAMRMRGQASATPKTETPQLASASLALAREEGAGALLQAATDWLGTAVDEVAAQVGQIAEAIGVDEPAAERFEARLLEQLDIEPTPPTALLLLSQLPALHPQNEANLLQRLHDQLRTRARRRNGEAALAQIGALLGDSAETLWQRLTEETRDQLYALLREGTDWSTASEEIDLLRRHRSRLPASAKSELLRVFLAGAGSQRVAVRSEALVRARAILDRDDARQVLDAFADRLDAGASVEATQELVAAADDLGPTDRVLWKLGEIGGSASPAAQVADEARQQLRTRER